MKKQFLYTLISCLVFSANADSSVVLTHGEIGSQEPPLVIQPLNLESKAWFDTDKYVLREKGKKDLDRVIRSVSDRMRYMAAIRPEERQEAITGRQSGPLFAIVGHTDSRASYRYNQILSENRAKAVADYLIERGVPAELVVWSGRGELQPVATNKTAGGRQQNRRVEIQLDGPSIKVVYN